jgi:hypothetical protein
MMGELCLGSGGFSALPAVCRIWTSGMSFFEDDFCAREKPVGSTLYGEFTTAFDEF